MLTLFLGLFGALCAVLGIVTIVAVLPTLHEALTYSFWMQLATLFLLGAIAVGVSSKRSAE